MHRGRAGGGRIAVRARQGVDLDAAAEGEGAGRRSCVTQGAIDQQVALARTVQRAEQEGVPAGLDALPGRDKKIRERDLRSNEGALEHDVIREKAREGNKPTAATEAGAKFE